MEIILKSHNVNTNISPDFAVGLGWIANEWSRWGLGPFVVTSLKDGVHSPNSKHNWNKEEVPGEAADIRTWQHFKDGKHSALLIQFAKHLQREGFVISERRWNARSRIVPNAVDDENYRALTRLGELCARRQIRLVVAQSPFRGALVDVSGQRFLKQHWARVRRAVLDGGGEFYNLHQQLGLDDEWFVDAIHLSAAGAQRSTRELVQHIQGTGTRR